MNKFVLALIVALVVAVATVLIIRSRDEYRIKKNLKLLAASVSKYRDIDEEGIAFLKKVARMKSLFFKDCTIMVGKPVPVIQGIEELIAFYTHAMRTVSEIKVTFHDISVVVEEDRKTAKTLMTAKADSPDLQEGGDSIDAREVEMIWKKYEGKWKITTVNEVKILY